MSLPETLKIVPADLADAPALLALQKVAFEPEARACQVWDIPPLRETVEGIREHIRMATVLKAMDGERLVGSIRGIVTGATCLIRVLMVAPDAQGCGVGALLLKAIEDAHPQVERFDLTTNMTMVGNLRFYLRHGYAVVEQMRHADTIQLAFMRKVQAAPA
ncbi:MAG: GNAT family N-acetyltransferase [Burkholderiaceae bacterium]